MGELICEGISVVEAGAGSIAGSMIGMMLADNGAHVTKLEPPGGDALRTWSPNGFLVWNRGKSSVVADLRTPAGRERALGLIERADVFIDGFGTGVTDAWGLDDESLRRSNPALVYCAVRGFASTGPYARLPAFEGVVAAKAGLFSRGMFAYRQGPIFANIPIASNGAAHMGLAGVLAALLVRDRTGRGQRVEASMWQGLSPIDYFGVTTFQVAKKLAEDAGSGPPAGTVKASRNAFTVCSADGKWFNMCTMLPHQSRAILRVCRLEHLMDQPRFARAPVFETVEDADEFENSVWEAFRGVPSDELLSRILEEPDVACEICGTTEDAFSHPQVVHNQHAVTVEDPVLGPVTEVGPIGRFAATPSVIARSAPALGEERGGPSGPAVAVAGAPAGSPAFPLAGVTIVEFGYFYAMPNGLALAAALGARVIKIEDAKGDPQRWSFGVTETGAAKVMQGKESLSLDLKSPEARAVVHRLVERADVFVCGFRPGVAERMDLGHDTLRELNPRLVYLHAGGYGHDGPQAHRAMYATIASALTGGYGRQSGPWLSPELSEGMNVPELRAVLGPRIFGLTEGDAHASLGVLSALALAVFHQQRTGQGQFVSTTMISGNLYGVSDDFVKYEGKVPVPLTDPEQYGLHALYRNYRAREGWVFLAVPDQRGWRALTEAVGRTDLAGDVRYADEAARRANDEELVGALAGVFAERPAEEWETLLLARDVACVTVNPLTPSEFTSTDPGLRESGLTFEIEHPSFGTLVREGFPVVMSETPGRLAPSCLTGQHTAALLAELGYGAGEIAALREAGAVFG